MSQLEVLRVTNMSGGRNTRDSILALNDAQSPDDLNLIGRTIGSIQRREGTTAFTKSSFFNGPVLGMFRYYKKNGKKQLLLAAGDELWYADGDDSEALKRIGRGFVTCQPWTFSVLQDFVYMGNFADLVYRWDGETLYQSGLAEPTYPAGFSVTPGNDVDGQMDLGSYNYKIMAVYGRLGPSNLTTEVMSATLVGVQNKVDFAGFELPAGATTLRLYRTLVNPPSNPALRIFYQVGDFVSSYTDMKNDDELINQYQGDTLKPFNAAYLTAHRNRMWYGYCMERDASESYSSRVAYSQLYQPDRIGGFVDVFPNDGDIITGIHALRGNLVVFKRRSIYQILGSSELDFEVRSTHADIGCVAPRSIAAVNNRLYFLAEDGVYYFDGGQVGRISDVINPDLEVLTGLNRFWAAGGSFDGQYLLSVSL